MALGKPAATSNDSEPLNSSETETSNDFYEIVLAGEVGYALWRRANSVN